MTPLINLKALRDYKNYSQEYVAYKMGISQSYYSKIENGQYKLTEIIMEKVLFALGLESMPTSLENSEEILYPIFQQQEEITILKLEVDELKIKLNIIEIRLTKLIGTKQQE